MATQPDSKNELSQTNRGGVQRLGRAGIRRFRPREVTKTAPSGDRTTRFSTWSASLPRIHRIWPGSWSKMFPAGAIFEPFPPNTGTYLLHPRPPPNCCTGPRCPRSVRGSYALCSIKALAHPPRAPWEEAPARSPEPGKHGNEESYGKLQKSARKWCHCICGFLEVSQEDTMEGLSRGRP